MSERRQTTGYTHKELGNPANCIRLLTLDVENDKHFLAGTLGVFDLDKKSNYVAASYEWGESDPQVDVVIDGKCLPVGYNLWLLLTGFKNRIRRGALDRGARIWIDAICIDQKNVIERNQQVSVMGQIYKSATYVFAWLGPPEGWTPSLTFQFIRARPWQTRSGINLIQVYDPELSLQGRAYPQMWEMVLRMCKCRQGDGSFRSFYWQRMLFWFVARLIPRVDAPTIMEIKATISMTMSRYIATGTEFFKAVYEPIDHSLLDLIKDFQGTGCKDTHDKIYSLLSLAREQVDISIDYKCSIEDLLANSFIKVGWNNPEHVKAVATELGFAENVLSSFGGPNVASNHRSLQSLTAIHRITDCHLMTQELGLWSKKGSQLEILRELVFSAGLCVSVDSLRKTYVKYKSSSVTANLSNHSERPVPETSQTAICEDGSVAIVCLSAQPGDYICQFGSADNIVVRTLREEWNEFYPRLSVVGTACFVTIAAQRSEALLKELRKVQKSAKRTHGQITLECQSLIRALEKVIPVIIKNPRTPSLLGRIFKRSETDSAETPVPEHKMPSIADHTGGPHLKYSNTTDMELPKSLSSPHQLPLPRQSIGQASGGERHQGDQPQNFCNIPPLANVKVHRAGETGSAISPRNPQTITGAFDIWDLVEFSRKLPPWADQTAKLKGHYSKLAR